MHIVVWIVNNLWLWCRRAQGVGGACLCVVFNYPWNVSWHANFSEHVRNVTDWMITYLKITTDVKTKQSEAKYSSRVTSCLLLTSPVMPLMPRPLAWLTVLHLLRLPCTSTHASKWCIVNLWNFWELLEASVWIRYDCGVLKSDKKKSQIFEYLLIHVWCSL